MQNDHPRLLPELVEPFSKTTRASRANFRFGDPCCWQHRAGGEVGSVSGCRRPRRSTGSQASGPPPARVAISPVRARQSAHHRETDGQRRLAVAEFLRERGIRRLEDRRALGKRGKLRRQRFRQTRASCGSDRSGSSETRRSRKRRARTPDLRRLRQPGGQVGPASARPPTQSQGGTQ